MALTAISMFKDVLLRNDVDFDVVKFTPNILVVVFDESIIVAGLSASIVNTNSMYVVSTNLIL